ncbi:MAG: hypothetical protein ACU0AZ_02395 [Paracoccaceae bacterium]
MDGIVLLHRAAGGWRHVGTAAPDDADLGGALARLRDLAEQLEPGQPACKVIIPNDQIRYLSVDTSDVDPLFRERIVSQALDEATPYALDDLAYDLSEDGTTVHVAAVARETLAEAYAFASEHRFHPVSFVAIPADQAFLGEPFFNAPDITLGQSVEPDGVAVVVIGDAIFPEPIDEPEPESSTEPNSVSDQAVGPTDVPAPAPISPEPETAPDIGFTSRRVKSESDAPHSSAETQATATQDPARSDTSKSEDPSDPAPSLPPAPTESIPAAPVIASRSEPASKSVAPAVAVPAASSNDFSSRRTPLNAPDRGNERLTPKPTAIHAIAEPPPTPAQSNSQAAHDETTRMTVFGARKPAKIGGKPRHLGLILTSLLVLGLVAAAAFATLYNPGSTDRDFRSDPTTPELAPADSDTPEPDFTPETSPDAVDPLTETAPAPLPELVISALPAPTTLSNSSAGNLSDTDNAVLDALRDETETDAEQLADEQIIPGSNLDQDAVTELVEPDPQQSAANEAALYAATGISSAAPEQPGTPSVIGLDDLYIASIDRTDLSQDAIALPSISGQGTDHELPTVGNPAAAGTRFTLNDNGLVTPTTEGTLNPDGVIVYLGKPPRVPPQTPTRFTEEPAEIGAATERLAGLRPKPRPTDLVEQSERAQLGGLSRNELAGVRPKLRPDSVQQQAEARRKNETDPSDPKLRLASSSKPRLRPSNIAQIAERARKNSNNTAPSLATASTASVVTPAPVATVTPKIPTTSSVARQATLDNALNLRKVNLIGVYGTPSDRRALVRLPSGSYRKVKVGDRVDGGRVVAIGDSELRYQKKGRNLTLLIPNG